MPTKQLIAVGVDIGQVRDPTAICVTLFTNLQATVKHLERLPLGTKYPDVANRIVHVLFNLGNVIFVERISAEMMVLVDITGVGRATMDMIDGKLPKGVRGIGVNLTGGSGLPPMEANWNVPKQELVDNLRRYMEEGRLAIPADLQELPALQSELRTFIGGKTASQNLDTGARQGAHDDLVIALGLSLLPLARKRRAARNVRAIITNDSGNRPRVTRGLTAQQQQLQSVIDAMSPEDRSVEFHEQMRVARIRERNDIPPGTIPGEPRYGR